MPNGRRVAIAMLLLGVQPLNAQLRTALNTPGAVPFGASVLSLPARVNLQDVPLLEALDRLSRHSGVSFAYSASLVPSQIPNVDCACEALTVREALDLILGPTPLQYVAVDDQVVIFPRGKSKPRHDQPRAATHLATLTYWPLPEVGVSTARPILAEPPAAERKKPVAGSIAGVVTDARSQRPIASAQVHIPGTGLGTLTNALGRYVIAGVPPGTVTVRVELIGYGSAERTVDVGDDQAVSADFQLAEKPLALDEVIVTGTAGGTQKRALGNSISRLDASKLVETRAVNDVGTLLNARAPGVVLEHNTGQVGSGPMITIRGTNTFSLVDQPLVYIDGIRADSRRNTGTLAGQRGASVSRLNDINPEDIESIEIIKGPAAATLYGTEAANGVIQIITKRGRQGRPEVGFSIRQGARWLDDPQARWPIPIQRVGGEIKELNIIKQEVDRGTPLFTTGWGQGYGMHLTGGSPTVQYYLSGDYDKQEGLMYGEAGRRITGRGNVTVIMSDKLSVSASQGFTKSRVLFTPVPIPVTEIPSQCRDDGRRCFDVPPEANINNRSDWQDAERFTGSIRAEYRPREWLAQRLTVGLDATQELDVQLRQRADSIGQAFLSATVAAGSRDERRGRLSHFSLDYSGTLNLPLKEALKSSTSYGLQLFRNQQAFTRAVGRTFAARGLSTISAAGSTSASGEYSETSSLGIFLQEQVGWRERLFVTGAVRADDHSAFGEDFSIVVYPKVSATWVISQEPFWERFRFIEELKLRSAWGASGQAPRTFSAIRTYNPAPTASGASAFLPAGMGNPDLGPERGQELELGFETALFRGRLSADFTYYYQLTKDAILARNTAPSQGFAGIRFVNAGEVKNKGVELLLTGRPIERRNFAWDLSLNFSHNENEIVHLGGDEAITLNTWTQHVPGFPVGAYFMRKPVKADFDPKTGRAINVMCDAGAGKAPVPCANAPRAYLGQVNPPTEAALNSEFSLGARTRLNVLVETKRGAFRENVHYRANCSNRSACPEAVYPERYDPARIAQVQLYPTMATYVIEDATFTRLREVAVNYRLPERWLGSVGLSRGSVTVAARNLWLTTSYSGWDPETFATWVERGDVVMNRRESRAQLPLPMTLQVNFNLTY